MFKFGSQNDTPGFGNQGDFVMDKKTEQVGVLIGKREGGGVINIEMGIMIVQSPGKILTLSPLEVMLKFQIHLISEGFINNKKVVNLDAVIISL